MSVNIELSDVNPQQKEVSSPAESISASAAQITDENTKRDSPDDDHQPRFTLREKPRSGTATDARFRSTAGDSMSLNGNASNTGSSESSGLERHVLNRPIRADSVLGVQNEPLSVLLFKACCGMEGRLNLRNLGIMLFILTLAVILAVFQYYLARYREDSAALSQFEQYASNFHLSLSTAWQQYEVYPQMMANFVAANSAQGLTSLTNQAFQQFSNPQTSYWDFHIVNHIEWIPHVVGQSGRLASEALIDQQLNRTGSKLFVFTANGKVPSPPAPYYYPIQFVSPCCSNDYIIGFNLANDTVEGPYIERARATGQAVTSAPFDLRGDNFVNHPHPKGLVVYLPVHFNTTRNISVSVGSGSQDVFLGVVTPVFVIHELMSAVLQERLRGLANTYVFLYDVTLGDSPQTAAYMGHVTSERATLRFPRDVPLQMVLNYAAATSSTTLGSANSFLMNDARYEFNLHDRRYRVITMATSDFGNEFHTFLPWAILLIALMSRFVINCSQAFRRSAFFARVQDHICPIVVYREGSRGGMVVLHESWDADGELVMEEVSSSPTADQSIRIP